MAEQAVPRGALHLHIDEEAFAQRALLERQRKSLECGIADLVALEGGGRVGASEGEMGGGTRSGEYALQGRGVVVAAVM